MSFWRGESVNLLTNAVFTGHSATREFQHKLGRLSMANSFYNDPSQRSVTGGSDTQSVGWGSGLGRSNRGALGNVTGQQVGLANMLGEQGQRQFSLAQPAYERGLNYYRDLLGSRVSQQQALAPAIRNITEGGVGARSAIRNRFARSGSRDMAFAEESRQRQGDINSMMAGAPQLGAAGLERMSNAGLNRSLQAAGLSSQALGSASASLSRERELEAQKKRESRSRWSSIGLGLAKIFAPMAIAAIPGIGPIAAPMVAGALNGGSLGTDPFGHPVTDSSRASG